MKQKITQIVIALTIILWFVPYPTAAACGNAVAFARRAKKHLADAKVQLQLGENERAIELATKSKHRGTDAMRVEADNIIDIAKVRLALEDPTFELYATIVSGKTPLEKMRRAEFLLAKKQPQKALKILRRLKRKGKMPNHFGWFALAKAEKILGHRRRAKYALKKGTTLKKKWDEERKKEKKRIQFFD